MISSNSFALESKINGSYEKKAIWGIWLSCCVRFWMRLYQFVNILWIIEHEKKWMQREENIWLVYFQREEYWCGIGSRRGTGTRWHTPLYPTTAFSQWRNAWPRSSVPSNTSMRDRQRWLLPWVVGAILRVPLCPHPIDALRAQTVFLVEENYRRERRDASSRTRCRKFSGGREDEGYKGNTLTFWKVLLSRT